jgi:hypothetical protein
MLPTIPEGVWQVKSFKELRTSGDPSNLLSNTSFFLGYSGVELHLYFMPRFGTHQI